MNFYFALRNVVIDFESMLSAIRSVLANASVHLQISSGSSTVASHEQHWPQADLQGQIFRHSTLTSVIFWTVISTSERSCRCFYWWHHARCICVWYCDEVCWLRTGELYCCGFEFSANLVGATAGLVNAPYKQWRRVLTQPYECRIYAKHPNICRRTEEDSAVSICIHEQFVTTGTHAESTRICLRTFAVSNVCEWYSPSCTWC